MSRLIDLHAAQKRRVQPAARGKVENVGQIEAAGRAVVEIVTVRRSHNSLRVHQIPAGDVYIVQFFLHPAIGDLDRDVRDRGGKSVEYALCFNEGARNGDDHQVGSS